MAPKDDTRRALARLFKLKPVADLPALQQALGTPSRRTVYRALTSVGYLASCSHAGRFYTFKDIPTFDEDGLWSCGDVLFSRLGTLRATVADFVQRSPAGQTQAELRPRLRLKVHDTLLDLVEDRLIGRVEFEHLYVYVSADPRRAESQVLERRRIFETGRQAPVQVPDPSLVIEVLLTIIHHPKDEPGAIARRLMDAGKKVSVADVEAVFVRYDLGKKKRRSRLSPP